MNVRIGSDIAINTAFWRSDVEPDERSPRNATWDTTLLRVVELEWPRSGRLIVRCIDEVGRPLAFTRHELELMGARNG